jgi:class 3 adenylate cyclase/tetratricopeptide (TPR) repeat protein
MTTPETPGQETRRLQAIMFTDMLGFSKMMGEDESRTIRLVEEHRAIVRAVLPAYGGREHQTIGDAFVVLFDSALNAVSCAVEIQKQLRERNDGKPAEEQVWIRVGIHLDDIVFKDGQIYGDGVNLAARVEPQAEPGGICVTEPVLAHVKGKVTFGFVSLGERALKNIARPPALYAVHVEGAPRPSVKVATKKKPRPLLAAGLVVAVVVVVVVIVMPARDRAPVSANAEVAALYDEALTLQRDAQPNGAISRLQQATTKDPAAAAAQLRLAAWLFEEDPLMAREAFQAAARGRDRLDEKDRRLLTAFTPYLAATVDPPGFVAAMDALADDFDDDAEVAFWRAYAHRLNGDHEGARAIAAAGDPSFLLLRWIQGSAAIDAGDEAAAVTALEACAAAAPSSTKCLQELVGLHSRRGRCAQMEQTARELVSRAPDDPDAERMLAYALAAEDVPLASVVEVLKRAQRKVSPSVQPISDAVHRARVFAFAGAFSESEQAAQQWQSTVSAHPDIWMHVLPATYVIGARLEMGRFADAGDEAVDFLRTAPAFQKDAFGDDWSAYFENVLVLAGRLTPAELEVRREAWVDEQWQKHPRPDRLVHLWRDAWGEWVRDEAGGKTAQAALAKLKEKGLTIPPPTRLEPGLALALGQSAFHAGDVDGALPFLEQAAASCLGLLEPYRSTRMHLLLGQARAKKGDVEGARAAFQVVVDRWGATSDPSVTLDAAKAGLAALPTP